MPPDIKLEFYLIRVNKIARSQSISFSASMGAVKLIVGSKI